METRTCSQLSSQVGVKGHWSPFICCMLTFFQALPPFHIICKNVYKSLKGDWRYGNLAQRSRFAAAPKLLYKLGRSLFLFPIFFAFLFTVRCGKMNLRPVFQPCLSQLSCFRLFVFAQAIEKGNCRSVVYFLGATSWTLYPDIPSFQGCIHTNPLIKFLFICLESPVLLRTGESNSKK